MNNCELTIPRLLDVNLILQQIVDWGLTLESLRIDIKPEYIILSISSEYELDLNMFEEWIEDLQLDYDERTL